VGISQSGRDAWLVRHGQAALSGSEPKAPGSSGRYLLIVMPWSVRNYALFGELVASEF
jgi:hypothetical protein